MKNKELITTAANQATFPAGDQPAERASPHNAILTKIKRGRPF